MALYFHHYHHDAKVSLNFELNIIYDYVQDFCDLIPFYYFNYYFY